MNYAAEEPLSLSPLSFFEFSCSCHKLQEGKTATFINSSEDLAERGKARSKRSSLNEEGMAEAMSDEEDRSGKAVAGQIPDEFMKVAGKTIPQKKESFYLLPTTATFSGDGPEASVAMGWSIEGLAFTISASCSSVQCFYPEIIKGDSVELFIDTRDVKN